MDYISLRNEYKEFRYNNFEIIEDQEYFNITYDFEIVGLSHFYPKWTIKKKDNKAYKDFRIIKEVVFNLGMVELVSYWKIACPKNVFINTNYLDEYQINWWKKLYYKGLGEFFYINGIKENIDDFMNIKSISEKIDGLKDDFKYSGNLIPVGGGKDSLVSIEILKDYFIENDLYVINDIISAKKSVIASGYSEKFINSKRVLDDKMLELNKQGFLNGHTPFSAIVAFSSILVSILYNKKYIVLSNEASANESTILNEEINHQYSKSYEFEVDFNEYINKYITDDIKYFSLLRPLSEALITKIFSTLKQYHKVFKSCNVNSKVGTWCNKCAKCLFVYVMLSAYLDDDELFEIFNSNLYDDESLYDLLRKLSGLEDNKPFECVGTRNEVQVALTKAIKRRKTLPILLKKYKSEENALLIDENIYDYFNNENLVIDEYLLKVKEKIEEVKNVG